ncbi:MAG: DUF6364 family protein [Spirochaetales bacterium]
MTTKLTLSVDSAVIDLAKVWARGRKKSVSALVEDYLVHLTHARQVPADAPVWASRLHGACRPLVPLADDTDSLIADALAEKHA